MKNQEENLNHSTMSVNASGELVDNSAAFASSVYVEIVKFFKKSLCTYWCFLLTLNGILFLTLSTIASLKADPTLIVSAMIFTSIISSFLLLMNLYDNKRQINGAIVRSKIPHHITRSRVQNGLGLLTPAEMIENRSTKEEVREWTAVFLIAVQAIGVFLISIF